MIPLNITVATSACGNTIILSWGLILLLTICTRDRMCIFGEIVNGVMHRNEAGHIVAWTWQDLPNHVPNGIWDAFVVMPNRVHGTIIITSHPP